MSRATSLRSVLGGALGIAALVGMWEGYKAVGPSNGWQVGDTRILPRTSDLAMPHVTTMISRLTEPTVGPTTPPLWRTVVSAGVKSLGIAGAGWAIGTVIGLALAMLMQRFVSARAAVLPWVVLSQTVPLIAIAPLVRRWGSQLHLGPYHWQDWMSVSFIAAYLAFFPVAVGALRGLSAPDTAHVDLMHVYGASHWAILRRLRFPAAVPYLLPALRLAAASAVIGTVVAEVSIGLRGGIGRMVIEYAQAASADPAKPWAPIGAAVAIGLIAAGCVGLLGMALRNYQRGENSA